MALIHVCSLHFTIILAYLAFTASLSLPLITPGANTAGGGGPMELTAKFLEQHKLHNDLRRDVSDMGMLMEVFYFAQKLMMLIL